MVSRPDGYALLSSEEGTASRPLRPSALVVGVLGALSFFYLTATLSSTGNKWTAQSASAAKSSFGRYERLKYEKENAALKEKLAQLSAILAQQQADAMNRAAISAGRGTLGEEQTNGLREGGRAEGSEGGRERSSEQRGGDMVRARTRARLGDGGGTTEMTAGEGMKTTLRTPEGGSNASNTGDRLTTELVRSHCNQVRATG